MSKAQIMGKTRTETPDTWSTAPERDVCYSVAHTSGMVKQPAPGEREMYVTVSPIPVAWLNNQQHYVQGPDHGENQN
jgi:hypothetical protein